MKRKIISFVILTCLLASILAGCGEASGKSAKGPAACSIKIDGKKYDLTEDVHDVIGQMVDNGLVVLKGTTMTNFSNDGYLETDPDKKINPFTGDIESSIFVGGNEDKFFLEENNDIPRYYSFEIRGEKSFETADGINKDSSISKAKALDNFYPYHGIMTYVDETYIAVYFDDTAVDLNSYEESGDSFKAKMASDNRHSFAINTLTQMEPENWPDYYESEIAVTNALIDGYKKLHEGSVNRVYTVAYSDFDGEMICYIGVYTKSPTTFSKK